MVTWPWATSDGDVRTALRHEREEALSETRGVSNADHSGLDRSHHGMR